MITAEIAGYILATENWCPDCIETWTVVQLVQEGYDRHTLETAFTVEEQLTLLAGLLGVDRDYADSDEFPVPFSGQQAHTNASYAALDGQHAPTCQCGDDFLGEF